MSAGVRLLLLAALPVLVGRAGWCAGGEVVAVTEGAEGPLFAPRQRLAVLAAVGQNVSLECRVLRLADKSVSWVRSSDLQILSHAGIVFTADARVSAAVDGTRHTLHIQNLRVADGGRYECQINTEPKMSLFFNLTVLDEPMPVAEVRAWGPRTVRGAARGAATLSCEARWEPPPRRLSLPPLDIRWEYKDQPIDLQSGRGGVSLDTERWPARVVSRLTLGDLRVADAGVYSCRLASRSGAAANLTPSLALSLAAKDTLTLFVDDINEEQAEGMQRDQSAGARVSGAASGNLKANLLYTSLTPFIVFALIMS